MELTRRTLLATTGVATVAGAGCLATEPSADDSPGSGDGTGDGDPDTVPDLTGHAVSDRAAVPDAERHSDTDARGLFVSSHEAAERYYADPDGSEDGAGAFVEETDFEGGETLVFVEAYAPQTCYRLGLESDPRVGSDGLPTVQARVDRTAPEDDPCGDALTAVRLLLRLSFDPDGPPADAVEVAVSGHRDEPEELLLEAER